MLNNWQILNSVSNTKIVALELGDVQCKILVQLFFCAFLDSFEVEFWVGIFFLFSGWYGAVCFSKLKWWVFKQMSFFEWCILTWQTIKMLMSCSCKVIGLKQRKVGIFLCKNGATKLKTIYFGSEKTKRNRCQHWKCRGKNIDIISMEI